MYAYAKCNDYCYKAQLYQVDTEQYQGSDLLFEPEHKVLETLGVSAIESLISVDSSGITLIPLQNYQGVCVKLDKGTELGWAAMSNAVCARVSTGDDDPECHHNS